MRSEKSYGIAYDCASDFPNWQIHSRGVFNIIKLQSLSYLIIVAVLF